MKLEKMTPAVRQMKTTGFYALPEWYSTLIMENAAVENLILILDELKSR